MGIPTSQNPDTLEGLENRLSIEFTKFWQSAHSRPNQISESSIEPEWISVELPHSSYSEDS
jgi:hypothetical protein